MPAGSRPPDVDLEPHGLVLVLPDRDRQAAPAARAFSGTSCTGFHPVGSGGAAGEPRLVDPRRVRGVGDVHVVRGEDLDRPVHVIGRDPRRAPGT